jgi:hypothetical protein
MSSFFFKRNEMQDPEVEHALESAKNALMNRVSNYLENYKPLQIKPLNFDTPVVLNG